MEVQCYICGLLEDEKSEIKNHIVRDHKTASSAVFYGKIRQHQCPKCHFYLPKPLQELSLHICQEFRKNFRVAQVGESGKILKKSVKIVRNEDNAKSCGKTKVQQIGNFSVAVEKLVDKNSEFPRKPGRQKFDIKKPGRFSVIVKPLENREISNGNNSEGDILQELLNIPQVSQSSVFHVPQRVSQNSLEILQIPQPKSQTPDLGVLCILEYLGGCIRLEKLIRRISISAQVVTWGPHS